MKKIYCGECDHYDSVNAYGDCMHPSNVIYYDTPYRRVRDTKKDYKKINVKNNCKLFKKINY